MTNRIIIFLLLTAISIAVFLLLVYFVYKDYPYLSLLFVFLSFATLCGILGKDTYPEYKIAWSLIIACLPGFGFVFYLFLGRKNISKRKKQKNIITNKKLHEHLLQNPNNVIFENDKVIEKCAKLVKNTNDFPIYFANNLKYYNDGEKFYQNLINSLKNAKKYVFMEYFIIKKGRMWNEILKILKQKAKDGIEIRIVYDDFGSIFNLPLSYPKKLAKMKIASMRFNKIVPLLDARANIRNHRKITIIDGKIAYISGANIADEYINIKKRFGYWKDCAASFEGTSVNNFVISFLEIWATQHGYEDPCEYLNCDKQMPKSSYILPFEDSPMQNHIYHNILLNLIYAAKTNIFIATPYLILNAEIKTALIGAAQSGVDVKIIIPHRPDKHTIFELTKAFSDELARHGIKILEFMPGFVHQKTISVDGKYAIVGSANLDLRSLYTNYECGILTDDKIFVSSVDRDFYSMLKVSKIQKQTKPNIFMRTYRSILRIFAPLM